MVQRLREFAALAEVQGLVPSTHRKAHVSQYRSPDPRNPTPSSNIQSHTRWCTDTHKTDMSRY